MKKPVGKRKTVNIIAFALVFMGILAARPGVWAAPEEKAEKTVLEVDYSGRSLSVKAVNAEAVKLLRKIAEEAEFKLAMPGFPEDVKVDVRFSDLPLEKGILRIIRALRSKASVSHVAVYHRKGGEDALYSLRVSYSSTRRTQSGPLPAPAAKIIKRARPAPKKISAGEKKEKEKKQIESQERRRQVRRRFFQELIENLQEEGWTREEIEGHIRSLKGGPEGEEQ